MKTWPALSVVLVAVAAAAGEWQPMPEATLESVLAREDLDLRSIDRMPKGAAGAILHYDFVGNDRQVYCVEIRGAAYQRLESRCYRRVVGRD